MSERSAIEWTDATWNPVVGCTKVSPGCDRCYAERITDRFGGRGAFAIVRLHPARLAQPLRWRAPRRVFVNSMSDLFHASVPDEFVARVFAVAAASQRHTYQVLTKRPARARSLLGSAEFRRAVTWYTADLLRAGRPDRRVNALEQWPLPNVWLGVSAEDQRWARVRVPVLLGTPAAVRFVSAEPLLGPITLAQWLRPPADRADGNVCPGLGWVIVGGESGPGARRMDLAWAAGLVAQCRAAGVAVFVKQLGSAWGRDHHDAARFPAGLQHRDYPPSPEAVSATGATPVSVVDSGPLGFVGGATDGGGRR